MNQAKTRRNEMKIRTRRSTRPKQHKMVTVRLGRLGGDAKTLRLSHGATVKDLVKGQALERCSIRVNGAPTRLSTELNDGDVVVAVPQQIVGSSAGRYDHLDLEEYRRTMAPQDFKFFVNFIGADMLGFGNPDLAVC